MHLAFEILHHWYADRCHSAAQTLGHHAKDFSSRIVQQSSGQSCLFLGAHLQVWRGINSQMYYCSYIERTGEPKLNCQLQKAYTPGRDIHAIINAVAPPCPVASHLPEKNDMIPGFF